MNEPLRVYNRMTQKDRRRKVFERVVNPIISKYMIHPFKSNEVAIAKNIPMKYLPYFKEVTKHKNAMNVRYRYRGPSTSDYKRDQSYIHMNHATSSALYTR